MRRAGPLGLAAALALTALLLAVTPGTHPQAADEKKPGISALRVQPLAGEEIVLADRLARGPVVFDFWATWCRPCAFSLPELQKLHEQYGSRGLTVIGVSLDGPRNASKVRPFAQRLGLTFPNVLDDKGDLQRLFQVQALPTSFLLSPAGEVVSVQFGYRPGEEKRLAEEIEKLLLPAADSTADSSAVPAPAVESGN